MIYFYEVLRKRQTPPRVHPLLLSLSKTWCASDISPDINSISEDDPRVFESKYYVPPVELPPLDASFSRDEINGMYMLSGSYHLC
jgi:hypothetical protein